MTKRTLTLFALMLLVVGVAGARELKPRIMFEKYLFAEGVDPKARYLDRLMVKFFDEDMVRLRNGELVSTNGRNALTFTKQFLARHPEITPEIIITSLSEEEYAAMIARNEERSGKDLVDLFSFIRFRMKDAPADPQSLLADILNAPEVEIAYYESIPYPTTCTDAGQVTPNYRANQTYHNPAPQGVDLEYAWGQFGEDLTDGVSTNRTAVIEYGTDITPTHEDYTTLVLATPENPADTFGYHGGSVAGIVGACEENGIGVVGFTADHQIRYYDITALASTADVYTRVNSQLNPGDYTTGSWAYFASPLPPGQTCPCNSSQNGHVPAEYDPATKTAIDNGVAGGIHYLLSAGNGCTNLDHATFGNTFRWATDTGAMIIGAVESTGSHDASCFTCYGERVTLNAWGDGIVTTARGTLFTGNGRREYYNASFGGTSGAGPIVAGCGGVLNNVYRDVNGGADISPTTLRSWLAQGGTAPASEPGNIGVMPNLFAIMSPNLNPDIRSGWTDYIVPRNTGDATSSDCVLPTTLVSDPDTTFWNSSIENTSQFAAAEPATWYLYRDDDFQFSASLASLAPQGRTYHVNTDYASTNVRGGRHTARIVCDPSNSVDEFYENDNDWTEQFVWNPRTLTAESPLQFSFPPLKQTTGYTGTYYNCDGYRLSSGFGGSWDLFAVMAQSTAADYDARIYSEAVTAQNGFDDYEAYSSFAGTMDIVGMNQRMVAGTALASVVNWDGDNDDYVVEGETAVYMGVPGDGRNSAGSFALGANELMEAVEFYVNELTMYEVEAAVTSGNANIVISIFGPDDSYFALGNRNASANAGAAGESEKLCFTPTQVGYHLAVIHKYNSLDWGETAGFTVYVGKAQFDLTHNLNAGWSHKIVVRQTTGGSPAVLPATLTGGANSYLNAAYINDGCVTSVAGLNNAFTLDGPTVVTTGSWAAWGAGATTYWSNQGPVVVPGGRHDVGDMIDVNEEGTEWNESNNRWDEQFVWSPAHLTNQTVFLSSTIAPNFRDGNSAVFFSAANQDGYRYAGNGRWNGVAGVPTNVGDDYNLHLYDPSTGSENGFDARLVPSWISGGGMVEFVLSNGNVNGSHVYDVGVCNNYQYPGTPSLSQYRMWQSNSSSDLVVNAVNGPYTLGANALMYVYDVLLDSGVATRFILDNMGAVDLGLAIFDANDAYGSRSNNGTIVNAGGDGVDENINFVPTSTGRHGIVVFKNDLTDLPACGFRLIVGSRVPAAPQHLVLQVLDASADPYHVRAHWDSVTTDAYGVPLNVDHYQIYYTLNHNTTTFPAGWTPYLTTTQATLDFFVAASVVNARFVVLAVDADGFILGGSPLPDGSDPAALRMRAEAPVGVEDGVIRPVNGAARE